MLRPDEVVESRTLAETNSKYLVKYIYLNNWKAAANLIVSHDDLHPESMNSLCKTVSKEMKENFHEGSVLEQADEIAALQQTSGQRNSALLSILPILYTRSHREGDWTGYYF